MYRRIENDSNPSRRAVLASGTALAFAGLHSGADSASAAPAEHGRPMAASNCALNLQGGQPITLSQFHGKVVYVDFWASWCTPCLLSFPFMNKLQHDFAEHGLQIVAVNMDRKADDALVFLSKHKPAFDTTVGANPTCAQAFGLADMPSTYLLDRTGMIRMSHSGFREGDVELLRSRVAALLAET